jgi:hypothetical protein
MALHTSSRARFFRSLLAASVLLAAASSTVARLAAQDPSNNAASNNAPSNNAAEIKALRSDLQRIETRLAALEAAEALNSKPAATPATAPPSTQANTQAPPTGEGIGHEGMPGMEMPSKPIGQEEPGQDSLDHGPGAIEVQIPLIPELRIRGFGDVRFTLADQNLAVINNNPGILTPPTQGGDSTFGLGIMDLFITSKISEKFSYLTEIGFEADAGTNGIGVDLERAQITYLPSDNLSVSFGRTHSMLGYYNTAFHHGTWFQTTMDRPRIFQFEDSGGILPIHNVGIAATAKIPRNALGLHFIAEVGNGRQSYSLFAGTTPANVLADHTGKSTNVGAYIRPEKITGLQAGFSWYQASLVPTQVPGAASYYHQNVFVAHAVYIQPKFEFMAEGVEVEDTARGSSHAQYTSGGYVQISKAFDTIRPFARLQWLNPNFADPNLAWTGHWVGPNAGVRWDVNTFVAFKIEYDHYDWRNFSDDASGAQVLPLLHKTINQLGLQLAYTF